MKAWLTTVIVIHFSKTQMVHLETLLLSAVPIHSVVLMKVHATSAQLHMSDTRGGRDVVSRGCKCSTKKAHVEKMQNDLFTG